VSDIKHLVMFSGGICSWAAAKRVVERHGTDGVVLLFADTLMEDEDLYRFLPEAAANVGVPLVRIQDGRNPWQVMRDERFIGNSRADPCSKILKRRLLTKWRDDNCNIATTTVHIGMSWDEDARVRRIIEMYKPWRYECPMADRPWVSKDGMFDLLHAQGIRAPRLYDMGFAHNNCGGFCIKAGQAHFAKLLAKMPERYAYHEAQEQALSEHLGQGSILTDRSGGTKKPLSLKEFRERLQRHEPHDEFDLGGCGCATD
jgi:hypothetical protein